MISGMLARLLPLPPPPGNFCNAFREDTLGPTVMLATVPSYGRLSLTNVRIASDYFSKLSQRPLLVHSMP